MKTTLAIMAASVLRSPKAVEASVWVVRAFVKFREALATNRILLKKLARAGRDTFKADPAATARLNLDILQRHGHKPGGDDEPAVTPAPATKPA